MRPSTKILLFGAAWLVVVSTLHACLNVNWAAILNDYRPLNQRKVVVAYIPVTCQLTCPVTDYISRYSDHGEIFLPRLFQGFPEIKEALIANKVQAAFIVAPLAIALASQGVPIKVVYLGHRYGSAVVVRKNGPIHSVADLKGHTVAIPSRFSDERLMLFRAMKVAGLKPGDIKMVEMAPPTFREHSPPAPSTASPWESPSLRRPRSVASAAFSSRPATTGPTTCPASWWSARTSSISVRRRTRSCRRHRRSGMWLDQGKPQREDAADFVGRFYYNQKPALLRWALTKPMDRVTYSPLAPRKPDFDLVRDLMIETGVLKKKMEFSDYADTRFSDGATSQTAWKYQPGTATAK